MINKEIIELIGVYLEKNKGYGNALETSIASLARRLKLEKNGINKVSETLKFMESKGFIDIEKINNRRTVIKISDNMISHIYEEIDGSTFNSKAVCFTMEEKEAVLTTTPHPYNKIDSIFEEIGDSIEAIVRERDEARQKNYELQKRLNLLEIAIGNIRSDRDYYKSSYENTKSVNDRLHLKIINGVNGIR